MQDAPAIRTTMRRPRINTPHRARLLGRYKAKPVYEFPVIVAQEWLDRDLHHESTVVRVVASKASDAAHLVWEEIAHRVGRPTQITVVGPAGGVAAHRFIGWESMVGAAIVREIPNFKQLVLPLS